MTVAGIDVGGTKGGLAEKLGQDLAWLPAGLGDDSGVVGAASLARASLISS